MVQRAVDLNLAGDVQVVCTGADTSRGHLVRCFGEGAGAMQHYGRIRQGCVNGAVIIEREDARLETQLLGQLRDGAGITPSQDRLQASLGGDAGG